MEITCPYCFNKFDSKNVKLRCRGMKCSEEEDKVYKDFWAKKGLKDFKPETKHVYDIRRSWWGKTDCRCDVCGAEDYDYVCPNCHNELPAEMIKNGAEIISVIGGPQSGKTHYIVALIHELLENGFEIGLRATPLQLGKDSSLHTTTKYGDAIKKLNDDLSTLDKTAKNNISVPWIIRVDSRNPQVRGKQEPKKSIYLVFYDTAGEYFDTPQQMEENTRYLRESKAVIVVFDTLSIPKIKQILEDNGEDTSDSDAATPFEKTWHALQNYINEGNEHLTDKPFAFVLSKFDVVLEHSDDLEFSPDAFVDDRNQYVDNSYLNGKRVFNVNQVEKADKVIRQVLEDRNIWDMAKYPTFVESTWGDNARFFGISAIGSMAKDGSIPEGGIKPYRVMDPLLWIMSKIGGFAFKTVNE